MEQINRAFNIITGHSVKEAEKTPPGADTRKELTISTTDTTEISKEKKIKKNKTKRSSSEKPGTPQKTSNRKQSVTAGALDSPAALAMDEIPAAELPEDTSLFIAKRREARGILCRQLADVSQKLRKGNNSAEEFSRMSLTLSRLATGESDPLVKNIATALVYDWVSWKDPVSDWMMKAGPIKGPSRFLAKIDKDISDPHRLICLGDKNDIPGFLGALWESTKGQKVPEKALRAVAHIAHTFMKRSEATLDPRIREKEPAEKDVKWARDCLSVLYDWWSNGQIELRMDSVPLLPGSADIIDVIYNEKVAVSGSSIVLSVPDRIPKSVRKELEDFLGSVEPGRKNAGGNKLPGELDKKDRDKAEKALIMILGEASPGNTRNHSALRKLESLAEQSKEKPWLRELLKPHIGEMLGLIREAEMRGIISQDNYSGPAIDWYAEFAGAIVDSFPESLNREFVQSTLKPLLLAYAYDSDEKISGLVKDVWKKKPELVEPTMEVIIDSNDSWLRDFHWDLLGHAAKEHGWMPGDSQVDNIAAQMYVLPGRREKDSEDTIYINTTRDSGFVKGMELVKALSEKSPDILQRMQLPDSSGSMVPIKQYVLDRMISDPAAWEAGRSLYTRGSSPDSWGFVKPLYACLFPDEQLTAELLGTLEQSYEKAGNLGKMDSRAQSAFAVLVSQDLPEAQAKRLNDIMMKDRYNKQGFYVLSDEIDKIRRGEIAGELKTLSSPELPASKAFKTVADIFKMSSTMGISSDYERNSDKTLTTMMDNLKAKKETQEYKTAASKLLADFRKGYREKGTIDAMGPEGVAEFQILERLSREESDLFGRMFEIFRSDLTKDQGYGMGVTLQLFDKFRRRQMDINLEKLKSSALPRKERFDAIDENFAIAKTSYYFKEDEIRKENLEAFRDNLKMAPAASGLPEMAEALKDSEHVLTAYKSIAPPEKNDQELKPYWDIFGKVLETVQGEQNFDMAIKFQEFITEEMGKGVPWEKALLHVGRCYTIGGDPRLTAYQSGDEKTVSATIETDEDNDIISLAGVKLDRRD